VAEAASVLVVEDDRAVARVVAAALRARGYRAITAATGELGLSRVAEELPAVIVLDLRLPDIDGIEVCRRIRSWSDVPIIVLTAEGSDQRKVLALDEGADDYVTKPFSMPELLARVRVAMRHRQALGRVDAKVLEVGDLRIDVPRREVTVAGRGIDLTPTEFDFLTLLARYPGRVLTHKAILDAIWGPEFTKEIQYVRVFANTIRKKLADDPGHPRLVTESGVGYRLIDPAADEDDSMG
jgi:two-component system KDP operon response regulator KdpE